jgi:hypothetical protein
MRSAGRQAATGSRVRVMSFRARSFSGATCRHRDDSGARLGRSEAIGDAVVLAARARLGVTLHVTDHTLTERAQRVGTVAPGRFQTIA